MKTFAQALSEFMLAYEVTNTELAKAYGCKPSYISQITKDSVNVTAETIQSIVKALNESRKLGRYESAAIAYSAFSGWTFLVDKLPS